MSKPRNTGVKLVLTILSALLVFGFLSWMGESAARITEAKPAIIEAEGKRGIDYAIAHQLDAGTAALRADTMIASGVVVFQWVLAYGLLAADLGGFAVCGWFVWREANAHKTR